MESIESATTPGADSVIELGSFIHQVGGRSAILVFGDFICMPLYETDELSFYQSLDELAPQLNKFVPSFRGVISGNLSENQDDYLLITIKLSDVFHETILTNLIGDKNIENRVSLISIRDRYIGQAQKQNKKILIERVKDSDRERAREKERERERERERNCRNKSQLSCLNASKFLVQPLPCALIERDNRLQTFLPCLPYKKHSNKFT